MSKKIFLAAFVSMAMAPAALSAATGPSSAQSPYLNPSAPGVEFTSILTVGDEAKKIPGEEGYRMAGIPDGLGAYDNGDGTFTLLMNHELNINSAGVPSGIVRAHGGAGAFVSKWKIRKSDLKVLNGEDLIKRVFLWDTTNQTYVASSDAVFIRFCSADLPSPTAFFNKKSGKGFNEGRIFLNGEEEKTDLRPSQRAFAHIAEGRQQGTTYELPLMGKGNWENLLASPSSQDKTIVIGQDDGGFNKVFIYIGEKQKKGNPIELAGLSHGKRYVLAIDGFTTEPGFDPAAAQFKGSFSLIEDADGSHGTTLLRPEDGAWDTVDPNRYYFVTTASITGNSRLWRLTFSDIAHPELGGAIEVLVDGNAVASPQIKMMDNIALDKGGDVYLLEDVGNNPRLGQLWSYGASTRNVTNLGQHDPSRFDPAVSNNLSFLTQDEESSGIIEVTRLFQGVRGYDTQRNRYFLLDVQAHYPINGANPHGFTNPDELVEGGQLLLMKIPKEATVEEEIESE
ncbi:MAG: hypothetical protein HY282_08880 [Nitrospirae bacterium]|nr:hypothetical protein [Candidatus Manganitrophaceae bacterium]